MWWTALAWARPVETEVEVVQSTETRSQVVERAMATSLGGDGTTLDGRTDLRGRCEVWVYETVQRQRVRTYPRRRRDRPKRPREEREILGEYTRIATHREEPCQAARTDLRAVVSICGDDVSAAIDSQGIWEVVLPPCASATLRIEASDGESWDLGDIPSRYLTPPPPPPAEMVPIPRDVLSQLPRDATPTRCSSFGQGSTVMFDCELRTPNGLIYQVQWTQRGTARQAAPRDRCSPCYPDTCLCRDCGDYDCAAGSGNGPITCTDRFGWWGVTRLDSIGMRTGGVANSQLPSLAESLRCTWAPFRTK